MKRQQKPLRKMMMSRKETISPAKSCGLMRSPVWLDRVTGWDAWGYRLRADAQPRLR